MSVHCESLDEFVQAFQGEIARDELQSRVARVTATKRVDGDVDAALREVCIECYEVLADGTTVVNLRDVSGDVVRVDRATQFGNPFRMQKDGGEYTREGCIQAYREWFREKIASDAAFREAVEELRGETLGCWCSPKPCHAHVILEYLAMGEV